MNYYNSVWVYTSTRCWIVGIFFFLFFYFVSLSILFAVSSPLAPQSFSSISGCISWLMNPGLWGIKLDKVFKRNRPHIYIFWLTFAQRWIFSYLNCLRYIDFNGILDPVLWVMSLYRVAWWSPHPYHIIYVYIVRHIHIYARVIIF